MPFDENLECPLCMEPLDIDDMNFYPCTCGYQICRFCWHRIRTDENSLCPACRKQYQEDPAEFKPLTEDELTKIKKERRQKDVARKQKAAENRRHLANIRVVQKNLVFVVGLSTRLADTEMLKRQDYFGKYGKILKVVINSSTSYAGAQGPSASAYITYTKPEDCLRAISAVNNLHVDGRTLKASLGTTKYCSHFLKGTQCTKGDCMYLHELGDEEASFTKEEMQAGRHQDYEQKLVDTYLTPLANNTAHTSHNSRTNVGDGVAVNNNNVKNTATSHQRKKTDSGSSNGSGKPKEPWPLLNSNRNSNQLGTVNTAKEDSESVTGYGDAVTEAKQSRNGVSHSPSNSSVSKMNGRSRSSPSSSCSTTSNPRTPTPEAAPNLSPLPLVALSEEKPSATTNHIETVPTSKSLLVARKLPFSDSPDLQTALENTVHQQTSTKEINSHYESENGGLISAPSQSGAPQIHGFASGAYPGTYRDSGVNPLPSDWHTSLDQAAAVASDDDLGFDPFVESNKGLADMLAENDSGQRMSPSVGYYSTGLPMHVPIHRPPPGVAALPLPPQAHMSVGAPSGTELFGIMSSVVTSSSPIVSCNTSNLLPPPPGLSTFPQYSHDTGLPQAHTQLSNTATDIPQYRGSRMLGLMNLGSSNNANQPPVHMMAQQSAMNTLPRSPYNENRMGSIQPPSQNHGSFSGLSDYNNTSSFGTQEMKDSLKALLPNASINFAVGSTPPPIQQSRLRNNYMPSSIPMLNSATMWNGVGAQGQIIPPGNGSSISVTDDQFTDPAIVSGCLSSETNSNLARTQPHWLKSIQQLTEMDPSPVKSPSTQPIHSMSHMPSIYRQPATHSRMPFAQNLSQPGNGSGWPTLQTHNPPPGFPSAFRSTTQNPHIATLES